MHDLELISAKVTVPPSVALPLSSAAGVGSLLPVSPPDFALLTGGPVDLLQLGAAAMARTRARERWESKSMFRIPISLALVAELTRLIFAQRCDMAAA
jgi:hypothetical protein